MTDHDRARLLYRVADLPAKKPTRFRIAADDALRAGLARELGISDVPALEFQGELRPFGRHDWELEARLKAEVVQPCVVTLAPVRTRLDEAVMRRYLHDMPEPEADEIEMPEDDTAEPLPAVIDLGAVIAEALALALPLYPRAEGADAALPEVEPTEKPFAGLADLLARKDGGKAG